MANGYSQGDPRPVGPSIDPVWPVGPYIGQPVWPVGPSIGHPMWKWALPSASLWN